MPFLLFNLCSRWIALRLDILTIMITALVSLMTVLSKGYISATLAGLALAYVTQVSYILYSPGVPDDGLV